MSRLGFFLSELRRRKVLGVAAAYLFVAWGLIEVSSTVIQMASAPAWIGKAILAVVAVGFPIALVVAWFFDLSSSGFVRTAALDAHQRAHVLGAKFSMSHVFAAAGVLVTAALVLGFAVWLRPASTKEVEFTQLTNFADAATAPALSPDGRMLAFLKGGGFFGNSAAPSQVYVKQLPDGPEVQLTNNTFGKATPAFSPDGSRIYFTSAEGNFHWSTHVVSVNGGQETEVLPNASGLSFLDEQNVLFAEVRDKGTHMGIRRATLTREGVRDVYWPSEDGMAHRAAASPDREWVLIVEMDGGVWQPCRLVPSDGSSPGRQVGPPASQCTYAAWSNDGRWMYFTTNAGGSFHIWRQRFPKGEPEQLTNGPTEEEGIAVAPDGRSLITSAGVRHNSIWLLDSSGDRQISVEGFAFAPVATRDGKRVYFLSRAGIARFAYSVGNLVVASVDGSAREELLPGHRMVHFDISSDDRTMVFISGNAEAEKRGIWVAPLDRSAAPRRILDVEAERVFFDTAQNVYFLSKTDNRFLHRLSAPDYTVNERIVREPVRYIFSMSPDGEWIVGVMDAPEGLGYRQVAISTRGRGLRVLCGRCSGGGGPARMFAPPISWTRDGRAMLVAGQFVTGPAMRGPQFTVLVPLRPGAALPALPETGITSVDDYLKLPGARQIAKQNILPGATHDQLFFYEATTIRNLYRVRLPD